MRHRTTVAVAVVLIVGGTVLLSRHRASDPRSGALHNSSANSSHHSTQSADKAVTPDIPQHIRIPKLGMQADIQAVGLNKQGNMAAPAKLTDTAWYKPGTRPGSAGNAVIAGHYGKPHQAAFWNLSQLKRGDTIAITDASKQVFTFVVTDTERVSPNEAQRQRIFGASDTKHLNLITCDGAWDAQTHSYDLRFIVYATLR